MSIVSHNPVTVRVEKVFIPTYLPAPPDRNPMFLEKRVYQGSSGKVYPLPFTDRISEEKTDREWTAIYIENDFLEVMILPEIGGRIHAIYDKIRDYDLIYRQSVIKPALVGLAGSWISGGIEFNWAQHHRPATFLPCDYAIEEHDDGSAIVWLGDHEPMTRMKSMHGVCLTPDRAFVELKVRVYNRTPLPQTFLWWANAATKVHEGYQSFFPPDVRFVADHAKRAMSTFPLCDGVYYGVDYGERARSGVPEDERPRRFVPPHISGAVTDLPDYAPNDLSWYANIPVPTSYMCVGSEGDFFGGYDHYKKAGIVHVADHRFAPGKKQWTWGNHDFGYAWDRNLSDDEAPYIELMAGVFTDNQPDFSHLAPWETKQWSQFWYGIGEIGPPVAATEDAALSVKFVNGKALVGICATAEFTGARIWMWSAGQGHKQTANLSPNAPYFFEVDCNDASLLIEVSDADSGRLLVYFWTPSSPDEPPEMPTPATEIAAPEEIATTDELYLAGRHLDQYRHATRSPEDYWQEILKRDSDDWRANNALGLASLRRGEMFEARTYFDRAIQRLTSRNGNPEQGDAFYNRGITNRWQSREPEDYDDFAKAAWNSSHALAARLAMAEIDCTRRRFRSALVNIDAALDLGVLNLWARNLKALILRELGRTEQSARLFAETRRLDPLDAASRLLSTPDQPRIDLRTRVDVAYDLIRAGFLSDVEAAIGDIAKRDRAQLAAEDARNLGALPLAFHVLRFCVRPYGDERKENWLKIAADEPAEYCHPHRPEDLMVLAGADESSLYYLGCLDYDRRRYKRAIDSWEKSAAYDPSFPTVWRNLGIAYFNVRKDGDKAREAYEKAFAASNESDARILYERDQLWKRLGESPSARLAELERFPALIRSRDDLSVEYAALLNQTGRHSDALALLESRRFQPWEGGEGLTLGEHSRARIGLGRESLKNGDAATARVHFEAALNPPENLGEAFHLLANRSDIRYYLGVALDALGDRGAAEKEWRRAAYFKGDFREMSVRKFSDMTFYSALALRKLGLENDAVTLFEQLRDFAVEEAKNANDRVDYFATSLPAMLLFDDDIAERRRTDAMFIEAQARFGLGEKEKANSLIKTVLERDPNHAGARAFVWSE